MASQVPRAQASRLSTVPSQKPRQLSHLHSQLAQLTANLSDLQNLLSNTAAQAENMRLLGGYTGGMWV
jgi:peptidoglycan hydrolase CwlO-like protein